MTWHDSVNLRPTLPDDIDATTASLILECWAADPAMRPSFPVILFRLQGFRHRDEAARSASSKMEKRQALRSAARSVHDLLWLFHSSEWSPLAAKTVLDSGITATARDETLRKILASDKGPACVKSLGWIMFGGFEDGAKIVPEPLLDEHIICNAEKSYAMITVNFAVAAPKRMKQWRVRDTKDFDELGKVLAEMEVKLQSESETVALENAVASTNADGKPRRKRAVRKKRKKPNSNQSAVKKNKELANL